MSRHLRKIIEVILLRLAIYILKGRNIQRSRVISRRDNNDLYYSGEKIDSIIVRIKRDYNQ